MWQLCPLSTLKSLPGTICFTVFGPAKPVNHGLDPNLSFQLSGTRSRINQYWPFRNDFSLINMACTANILPVEMHLHSTVILLLLSMEVGEGAPKCGAIPESTRTRTWTHPELEHYLEQFGINLVQQQFSWYEVKQWIFWTIPKLLYSYNTSCP